MAFYFGGSRSLPQSALVAQVVAAVLSAGQSVHVGCSAGADAQVIRQALRSSSFPQVRVFSAFGALGQGSLSCSAVQAVQAWAHAGGQVIWWAGGQQAVPPAARLIRRSVAALAGCSCAVFFQPGAGSLAVAAQAVQLGLSVVAFSQFIPAAIPGAAGHWQPGQFQGFTCWRWSSRQLPLF